MLTPAFEQAARTFLLHNPLRDHIAAAHFAQALSGDEAAVHQFIRRVDWHVDNVDPDTQTAAVIKPYAERVLGANSPNKTASLKTIADNLVGYHNAAQQAEALDWERLDLQETKADKTVLAENQALLAQAKGKVAEWWQRLQTVFDGRLEVKPAKKIELYPAHIKNAQTERIAVHYLFNDLNDVALEAMVPAKHHEVCRRVIANWQGEQLQFLLNTPKGLKNGTVGIARRLRPTETNLLPSGVSMDRARRVFYPTLGKSEVIDVRQASAVGTLFKPDSTEIGMPKLTQGYIDFIFSIKSYKITLWKKVAAGYSARSCILAVKRIGGAAMAIAGLITAGTAWWNQKTSSTP